MILFTDVDKEVPKKVNKRTTKRVIPGYADAGGLDDMNAESLIFWMVKFIQDEAPRKTKKLIRLSSKSRGNETA
ncbi:hypothetical protein AC249_AIPGENE22116 [Exaiptasia diaphana]|nr:hypothetical protein AC249_AIPGENE22116 [Exaiptasia diaphana]